MTKRKDEKETSLSLFGRPAISVHWPTHVRKESKPRKNAATKVSF